MLSQIIYDVWSIILQNLDYDDVSNLRTTCKCIKTKVDSQLIDEYHKICMRTPQSDKDSILFNVLKSKHAQIIFIDKNLLNTFKTRIREISTSYKLNVCAVYSDNNYIHTYIDKFHKLDGSTALLAIFAGASYNIFNSDFLKKYEENKQSFPHFTGEVLNIGAVDDMIDEYFIIRKNYRPIRRPDSSIKSIIIPVYACITKLQLYTTISYDYKHFDFINFYFAGDAFVCGLFNKFKIMDDFIDKNINRLVLSNRSQTAISNEVYLMNKYVYSYIKGGIIANNMNSIQKGFDSAVRINYVFNCNEQDDIGDYLDCLINLAKARWNVYKLPIEVIYIVETLTNSLR